MTPTLPSRVRVLAAALALTFAPAGTSAEVSASCQTIRGRMDLWNGAPSVRIWVVGTKRVLGVKQPHESLDDLPASVRAIWSGRDSDVDWSTAIVGDFKVCALEPRHPGRMQSVRLVDGFHLTTRRRR